MRMVATRQKTQPARADIDGKTDARHQALFSFLWRRRNWTECGPFMQGRKNAIPELKFVFGG